MLPLCAEHGIAYVPFGPLAGGWLAGKYARGAAFPEGSRMTMRPEPYEHLVADRVFDGLDALAAEAAERGISNGRRSRSPGCSRIRTSPPPSAARRGRSTSSRCSRRSTFRSRPRSATA